MQEYQECDDQVLSLIIRNPEFLNNTIIKDVYLKPNARILFNILTEEYNKNGGFIIENLQKYKQFDARYFSDLLINEMYDSSRNITFRLLEKSLILRYKAEMTNKLIENFDGDFETFYNKLTKIKNINYNEAEYLTAEKITKTLESEKEQIKLGYKELDNRLNLSRNDFLILAGGTGTGKTAFALNLLVNLSKDYQCVYFNQEMSTSIIYRRIVSIVSGVDIRKLRDYNHLEVSDRNKTNQAISEIDKRKIILENKVVDIKEIENTIANITGDKHIIAIIDHIGLIKSTGKSLYERMTEIAKEIRRISMNYNCTIIGLCQLSRDGQRGERMPVIQDLRDSGEIEQSARGVLLLYNPEPTEEQIQHMQIIIGKNGNGDKIIKSFDFNKYTQTFYEV